MLLKVSVLIVCLILAALSGCRLISGRSDEVVLAATDFGTPDGAAVTKDIGPAGGTLASPDGRFTLTVPQNALAETMTFSIQPITNKVQTGFGHAHRFGPDGRRFTTPLELSVRYDESDIAGTIPEALAVAFQDDKGSWHLLKPKGFDAANKTITVSITHFTDFSFFSRLKLAPAEATIRPGQNLTITALYECRPSGLLDKLLRRASDCDGPAPNATNWQLRGPGAIKELTSTNGYDVFYTAPAKKPADNIAWVELRANFVVQEYMEEPYPPLPTGRVAADHYLSAKITIQDQAYQAIGQHEALTLSGVICSLDEPFTVPGVITGYPMKYEFRFTPSSHTAGSVKWSGSGGLVAAEGSGTYTVEGLETAAPKIVMKTERNVGHAPPGSATGPLGTGDFLTLLPLENAECK